MRAVAERLILRCAATAQRIVVWITRRRVIALKRHVSAHKVWSVLRDGDLALLRLSRRMRAIGGIAEGARWASFHERDDLLRRRTVRVYPGLGAPCGRPAAGCPCKRRHAHRSPGRRGS